MADYVATTEDMTTVANAIRTKGGTSAPLSFPDEFASAIQAIAGPKSEQEKEITISENGDYPITPDVGKVLSKVLAHVNVSGGGGGFDPAPFKAIEVLSWTPASDTGKHVFKTAIKAMACFITAVPTYDGTGTGTGIGRGFSFAVGPFSNGTFGTAWPIGSKYTSDGKPLYMSAVSGSFSLEPYGGLKFKAGREYIVTVFEI